MIKLVNRLKLIFYATNIAYFSQTTKFGCLKINQDKKIIPLLLFLRFDTFLKAAVP